MKTTIGIVDDHLLFAKALGLMLNSFNDYDVIIEASNGKDLQEKLQRLKMPPSIMLIDVNMPVMNGLETAKWLHNYHPSMRLVALSMNDKDHIIIDMIRSGCCAYLLKETHPDELEKALQQINATGYYNADASKTHLRDLADEEKETVLITEREKKFLQLACSDLTYNEIAEKLSLSERTIDGYRETLFRKLNVHSRVGLALESIRRGLVTL